jgi:hypothetical protein
MLDTGSEMNGPAQYRRFPDHSGHGRDGRGDRDAAHDCSGPAHDFQRRFPHTDVRDLCMATTTSVRLLVWSPRILGILVSLFLGLFALDAFSEGRPLLQALPDFIIHLIPAFTVLGLVAASCRRQWIGGVGFIGLAVLYAATVPEGRLDWMLAFAGPLMVVGALFMWSWFLCRPVLPVQAFASSAVDLRRALCE